MTRNSTLDVVAYLVGIIVLVAVGSFAVKDYMHPGPRRLVSAELMVFTCGGIVADREVFSDGSHELHSAFDPIPKDVWEQLNKLPKEAVTVTPVLPCIEGPPNDQKENHLQVPRSTTKGVTEA